MEDYIGQKVQMATIRNSGVIDDHFDVNPDFDSDCRARREGDQSLRRYSGFLRRDFNVANGPEQNLGKDSAWQSPRNYRTISIEFRNLPLEEALVRARSIASTQRVVLYLEREFPKQGPNLCHREIVWCPEGWQPRLG